MKKILLSVLAAALSLPAIADEGMWLLPLLKQQKFPEMQALGLKLQDYDIYSPDSASLKDAVVIFGGGCTGEIVSPDGLLLTNHHCGYGQIQQHSTLEHDYLTDGFWAVSRDQELPNPGLTVTFIDKIEDVTDYVKAELTKDTDPNSMNFLSPKYLNGLAKTRVGEKFLQDNPGTDVEIKAFYGGNVYYMFTKKIYSDIRLVGAPPSSVGKFGADTDNWMWPRHTGDFSVFRVYADVNGNPAEYSESNVPLRPKRWFKISIKGVEEDDYAMMMGFPGRTNKYYTSWEVAERRDIDNTVRINIRNLRQEVMLDEMLKDPSVRIQYASKYAGSTNAYKNAIGSNWAIKKRNFEQVKKEEQDLLIAWAQKNNETTYPEALSTLEQIVSDRKDLRFRSWMLDEAILRGIEFTKVPAEVQSVCNVLKGKDRNEQQKQIRLLDMSYHRFADKDYSPEVDRKIAKVMLKEYRRLIPAKSQPAYFALIDKKFKGDVDRFVDYLFEKSIYGSEENFEKFKTRPSVKTLEEDPMILFAKSVQEEKANLNAALADFDTGYALAHREYVKGLLAMYQDKANFPDANFSLRLTYGQVKGYRPKDAVYYNCQTTLDGVMEKEDSTNWEFVVPGRLKALYEAKDFGRYQLADGRMPVAFSATTHTTGGNSGSPVLNANGELIGINFDRNWEGVGGDIQYLPDYQRSIIVDIRYVLFLIDKYAGASYLLKEMELVE
ncbi:S46 family peptidase [Parabacteroides faecis]|uniref:S46 family peptidase n=1 Tax=Parabacteroides TaxID=375288 RepID=UPI000EFFB69A|nr:MULTISPECIES: S46 family peptidase [Parabacteroides]MBC8616334.1 S46 family peptidase [Parabacteroides faecis]RHR95140.1 S46 family peptidase [Parabacteroides sp. AF14-59]